MPLSCALSETVKPPRGDVAKYKSLYPALNVDQQLRDMIGWCESHPAQRKTRRGAKAFITSWLLRQLDKGGDNAVRGGGSNARGGVEAKLRLSTFI